MAKEQSDIRLRKRAHGIEIKLAGADETVTAEALIAKGEEMIKLGKEAAAAPGERVQKA